MNWCRLPAQPASQPMARSPRQVIPTAFFEQWRRPHLSSVVGQSNQQPRHARLLASQGFRRRHLPTALDGCPPGNVTVTSSTAEPSIAAGRRVSPPPPQPLPLPQRTARPTDERTSGGLGEVRLCWLAGWLAATYMPQRTTPRRVWGGCVLHGQGGARDPVGGGEKSAAQSTACQLVAGRQAVGEV